MRLICPHCGKAHIVREEALRPEGRQVRCSSCKSMWFVDKLGQPSQKSYTKAPVKNVSSKALIEQTQKAAKRPPGAAKKRQRVSFLASIEPGAAILGALLVTLCAGILFREAVVKTLPQFASLYTAMGLKVNIRGFEFGNVTLARETANGEPILVVQGEITNISSGEKAVPPVHIILRSPTGAEIRSLSAVAEAKKVAGNSHTSFKTTLANPPPDAKDVLVRFSGAEPSGS